MKYYVLTGHDGVYLVGDDLDSLAATAAKIMPESYCDVYEISGETPDLFADAIVKRGNPNPEI
jgi:hypothetical protein